MTYDDIKAGLQARADHLAEVRAQHEEYQNAQKGGNSFAASTETSTSKGNFKF